MRAGSLDRRVTLLRRGAAVDNGYELVPGAWAPLGQRYASIRAERRNEATEQQGLTARRVMSLWLNNDALVRSLTAQDAVLFDARVYELVAEPVEVDRHRGIELLAVAGPIDAVVDVGETGVMDFGAPANSGLLVLLMEDF
jgi:head-tail adaptor